MPDDLGLFPPTAPRNSERYAARPAPKDWGVAEDAALLPAVVTSLNQTAYMERCVVLCETLDRVPLFAPDARPSRADYMRECTALVEMRTVTRLLSTDYARSREVLDLIRPVHDGARGGTPLTWGEAYRFLQPYFKKKPGKRIPRHELLLMMRRDRHDLRLLDAFEGAGPGPLSKFPEPQDRARIVSGVIALRDCPPDDPAALRESWGNLWAACGGSNG